MRSLRAEGQGLLARGTADESFIDAFGAEAGEIASMFRQKLANLRGRMLPRDMPAAVRALLEEKRASLRGLRERRPVARHWRRVARQDMPPPPLS